ncbi:hypothetical protein [Streptomyces sp. NPDC059828]|uniref:hypothetical protein n=1 Tax=Streptomyces sp. NPDC059828 TaxID=3346965 RepID=UPI00364C07D8
MAGLPIPVRDIRVRFHYVGGCGPFADITATFEPPGDAGEPDFVNLVPDEDLPDEYVAAYRAGVAQGLGGDVDGGDGIVADVLITAGRHHIVDSSEYGFKIAGQMAARAVLITAGILPPVEAHKLTKVTWPEKSRLIGERGPLSP